MKIISLNSSVHMPDPVAKCRQHESSVYVCQELSPHATSCLMLFCFPGDQHHDGWHWRNHWD